MKKRLKAAEMKSCRRMLRTPCIKQASNDKVFQKMDKKVTIINRLRKKQLKFLRQIMRKEMIKELTLIGILKVNNEREKQHITLLTSA